MIRIVLALLLIFAFTAQDGGEEPQDQVRFVSLDVFIDTGGKPLAAWQFELLRDAETTKIVGISGDKAYGQAPWYDPAALHKGGRIIIAAFTTDAKPPAGRIRVATISMQETGPVPEYSSKLMAAAAPGGERIDARIDVVRKGGK